MTAAIRRHITWDEFGTLVRELALRLAPKKPDVVVGIARGGSIVGSTLSFLLGVEHYPIGLKKTGGGATRVVVPPAPDLKGRFAVLVDDFSKSGDSFRIARHELSRVGCERLLTAALVRRVPGYSPEVWALEISGKVRFPWAAEQIVGGALCKRDELL